MAVLVSASQRQQTCDLVALTVTFVGFFRYNSAKKDNDFIFHEAVPALDTLQSVKGERGWAWHGSGALSTRSALAAEGMGTCQSSGVWPRVENRAKPSLTPYCQWHLCQQGSAS